MARLWRGSGGRRREARSGGAGHGACTQRATAPDALLKRAGCSQSFQLAHVLLLCQFQELQLIDSRAQRALGGAQLHACRLHIAKPGCEQNTGLIQCCIGRGCEATRAGYRGTELASGLPWASTAQPLIFFKLLQQVRAAQATLRAQPKRQRPSCSQPPPSGELERLPRPVERAERWVSSACLILRLLPTTRRAASCCLQRHR